jgi:hypothetical protein
LHAWLLRIVVTSTATTSLALACRWREPSTASIAEDYFRISSGRRPTPEFIRDSASPKCSVKNSRKVLALRARSRPSRFGLVPCEWSIMITTSLIKSRSNRRGDLLVEPRFAYGLSGIARDRFAANQDAGTQNGKMAQKQQSSASSALLGELYPPCLQGLASGRWQLKQHLEWSTTMKTLFALTLILAGLAATAASADRPFGSSNQGPPSSTQNNAR